MEDSTPIKVADISFINNVVTKEDVLRQIYGSALNASTWGELTQILTKSNGTLAALISPKIKTYFNVEEKRFVSIPSGPRVVNLQVELEDDKRHTQGSASVFYESTLKFAVAYSRRNLFGRGEVGSFEADYAPITQDLSFAASFIKPLVFDSTLKTLKTVLQRKSKTAFKSNYTLYNTGAQLELASRFGQWGRYTLAYEGVWRTLEPKEAASVEVRKFAGDTLKSAVRATWTLDKRDDPCTPERGSSYSAVLEVAGLGGDVKYLKTSCKGTWSRPILQDFPKGTGTWSLGSYFRAGVLIPLWDTIRIQDRFHLLDDDQPFVLRGFKAVGPISGEDSLGGDLMISGGVHVTSPPIVGTTRDPNETEFRLHAFWNCGNLVQWSKGNGIGEVVSKTLEDLIGFEIRSVVGVGLVGKFVGKRIEVNVCRPIRHFGDDEPVTFSFTLAEF